MIRNAKERKEHMQEKLEGIFQNLKTKNPKWPNKDQMAFEGTWEVQIVLL